MFIGPLEVIGLILVLAFLSVSVAFAVRNIGAIRNRLENFDLEAELTALPDEFEYVVRDAIALGTVYAEQIDLNGKIQGVVKDFANKGEAKLYAAVRVADMYIEAKLGINLPEELIIAFIEEYIFDNPDIFGPNAGTDVVAVG